MGGSPTRGAFVYTGRGFPSLTGRHFSSVAEFCRTARIDQKLVYGRVYSGWPLVKALDTPKLEIGNALGLIYKITRTSTGEIYIGLTIASLATRWSQHVRSAASRTSPLACAIAADGPDGFTIEPLEENLPLWQLPDRERHWIAKLNTRAPFGLNKHPGGAIGGGGQREVEHEGETFCSVAEASKHLAARHGLTRSAAHQRLRKGKPLNSPLKIMRTIGRGVAGTFLWSRWRAMRNNPNSELSQVWEDWDQFSADLAHLKKSDRLIRPDLSKPWGPDNYRIHRNSFINHPRVGTLHWTRWRLLLKSSDRRDGRGVVEEWREFDIFERDVSDGYFQGGILVPLDWGRPWGPDNFFWGTQSQLSRLVGLNGRKHRKHGEYKTATYRRWLSMHNDARRNGSGVAQAWHEYLPFRDAVGDGVERGLVLIRPDRSQPWGPNNFRLATPTEYRKTLGRFTHRRSNTRLYKRWQSMRGNAITSGHGCDPRWLHFLIFATDLGNDRPECDLERVDRKLPFGPDNFIWVDRAERRAEVSARRKARKEAAQRARDEQSVTVSGVTYRGLYALAEAYGVPASTVCFRVRGGMTPEDAVTIPNKTMALAEPTLLDGLSFPSKRAALLYVEERYGIRPNTMQLRMKGGLTLEEAAHKPPGRNSKQFRVAGSAIDKRALSPLQCRKSSVFVPAHRHA